jgi:hypothetical protein
MDAGAGSLFKEGGLETTDWLAECVEYKGIDGSITNEQKDHEVGFVHGCKCEWSMQVTLVRLVGKMAKGRWILGEDEAEIWNLGSSNRVEYPWDTELAQ